MINVLRRNDSILDYGIDGDGPEMSGSDGSVDIISDLEPCSSSVV